MYLGQVGKGFQLGKENRIRYVLFFRIIYFRTDGKWVNLIA
jgi:hypothetical protein